MNVRNRTSYTITGVAVLALLGLSACSNDDDSTDSSSAAATTEESMESEDTMADPAATLVGTECEAYAAAVPEGPGSIEGMSTSSVTEAASNNPMLTTLTAAVSGQLNPDVNLVETLDGGEFTVFAPVDDAFAQIDAATIEGLKTDSDTLTKILTYHVVPGQLTPDEVTGDQTTVEGGTVTVTGSGDDLMVNDAQVLCGGVMTDNATVYLIDSVLMPTS